MNTKTHYIFDFDGTVSDSQWYWRRLIPQVLLDRGIPVTEEHFARCKFMSADVRWQYLKEEFGLSEEDAPTFEEKMVCLENYYRTANRFKPGALEYLKSLKAQGKTLALFSATRKESLQIGVESLGVTEIFDYIFSATEIGVGKGKPESYLHCLQKMGAAPENCVMVEDALYSMKTAKSLGITVYAVAEGCFEPMKEEILALADKYCEDFREFME